MGFRNKLSHIKTEAELFEYFSQTAGYQGNGTYYCAGLYSDDTAVLFQKLKKAWEEDIINDAKSMLIKENV